MEASARESTPHNATCGRIATGYRRLSTSPNVVRLRRGQQKVWPGNGAGRYAVRRDIALF